MSFQPMKFRVRECVFDIGPRYIVLQETVASSALVAVSNFILLSQPVWSGFNIEGESGGPKYVLREVLTEMIEEAAVKNVNALLAIGAIDIPGKIIHWKWCSKIIRRLHNGFTLRPTFTSTSFEEHEQDILFHTLATCLCHGWLVDPQDADTAKAIGSRSYEEILSMSATALGDSSKIASQGSSKSTVGDSSKIASEAVIIKQFLDNSKDQLTPYGLRYLHQEINIDSFVVLFKNNCYHLVYKHEGTLLILQTDKEQVKRHPDAVWRSLEVVNGVSKLFTGTYTPINQQDMGSDGMGTARPSNILKAKPSKKKRNKVKRQELLEKSMDDVRSHLVVPLQPQVEIQEAEVKETPKELDVKIEETREELDDAMSGKFNDFLSEFTEEGAEKPYFEGQVKALHYCGSFKIKVGFNELKSHDEDLARYICDNMPRVSERLTQCVLEYLLTHLEFRTKLKDVFMKTTLEISDLPKPNSVLPFRKFAQNNKMHRVWTLFDYNRKKVNVTTYVGRQVGLGLVKCILKNHKAGRCWAGSFNVEDIQVLTHSDGSLEFVITAKYSNHFTEDSRSADFDKLCIILLPHFLSDELDEMPAYFDMFQLDYLTKMPKFEDEEAYGRWQRYMSSHFAFKAPQVCATLIAETFEVCWKEAHATSTDKYFLLTAGDLKGWVNFVTESSSLSLNDTYRHGATASSNRYDDLSYYTLLMFGRHYTRHMLETKKRDGTAIPVQDLAIKGLMLGHVLQGEMAKVIQYIMMKTNFGSPLLSSVWRYFEASETYDEVQEDEVQEANTADVATSADVTDMVVPP